MYDYCMESEQEQKSEDMTTSDVNALSNLEPTLEKSKKKWLWAGLVFAVLILTGGAVWAFTSQDKGDNNNTPDSQSQTRSTEDSPSIDPSNIEDQTDQVSKNDDADASPSDNENYSSEETEYLVIEEWGIRFKLPNQYIGDIGYSMDLSAYEGWRGPIILKIHSAKVAGLSSEEGFESCLGDPGLGAEILSINQDQGETDYPPAFKQLDSTYYYFGGGGCQEAILREDAETEIQYVEALETSIAQTLEVTDPSAYVEYFNSIEELYN